MALELAAVSEALGGKPASVARQATAVRPAPQAKAGPVVSFPWTIAGTVCAKPSRHVTMATDATTMDARPTA